MNKICLNIILIAALVVTAASGAEQAGSIVSATGKATATEENGTTRNLELKSAVFQNDTIKTEAGASLQMMLLDESVITIGEKSEMVIDEYVYNPTNNGDNKCSVKMVKGVFNTVTAKITALNPERFKVKTRMATIGIRGCEVAFTITERGENVYAISLPEGKSLIITVNAATPNQAANAGGTVSKEQVIEILKAGVMVSIDENGGTSQRAISNQEAIDLVTGASSDEDSSTDSDSTDNVDGEDDSGDTGMDSLTDVTDSAAENNNDDMLVEEKEDVEEDLLMEEETTEEETTEEETPITEEEDPVEDPGASAEYFVQGTGIDWEWGIWEIAGQTPEKVDFIGKQILTPMDVQTLYGGTPYNLTGINGESAAIIKHNGITYFVQGACDATVNIGTSSANNWSISTMGTPAVDGKGTSLGYYITGIITAAGSLQANGIGSVDYSLTVGGSTYTGLDIVTQNVKANLTGTGTVNPPSGIVGQFDITHDGGATSVQGGFGSDLSLP